MEVIALADRAPFVAQDGAVIRELCAPRNSSARNQSLAEAVIPAGGRVREHYHRTTEEIYHVAAGRGRMRVDGVERDIGPGDTVLIRPGQRHAVAALGSGTLRLLVSCAPAYEVADQVMTEL
jgi:mannose-6-phosphate isomerase-like protein (cupin superfamily)